MHLDSDSRIVMTLDAGGITLLASVDKSTGRVSQYVGGSQWGERWKCGSEDAVYYFGQV